MKIRFGLKAPNEILESLNSIEHIETALARVFEAQLTVWFGIAGLLLAGFAAHYALGHFAADWELPIRIAFVMLAGGIGAYLLARFATAIFRIAVPLLGTMMVVGLGALLGKVV